MSCSNPLIAIKQPSLGYTFPLDGSRPILEKGKLRFLSKYEVDKAVNLKEKYGDRLVYIPCGHCESCKLSYRKDWAVRCEMESLLHRDNCFLTLTYDNEHLLEKPVKEEISRFIKDLRDHFGIKFRYFGCGENGHLSGRAHYHLIMFGYKPHDLKFYGVSKSGEDIFTSKFLDTVWKRGSVKIGEFNIRAASYVAGYVSKKLDADNFLVFSTHPGIGFLYMHDNLRKLFMYGNYVGKNGQIHTLPRYFDKICEKLGYDNIHIKLDNSEKMDEINKAIKFNRGIHQDTELFSQNGKIMKDKLKRLKRYV